MLQEYIEGYVVSLGSMVHVRVRCGLSWTLIVISHTGTGLVWQPLSLHVDSLIYHRADEWPLSSAPLVLSLSINKLCFCSPMYAFLFFPSFCRNRLCKVCIMKGNRYYLCNLKGKIPPFI